MDFFQVSDKAPLPRIGSDVSDFHQWSQIWSRGVEGLSGNGLGARICVSLVQGCFAEKY